jgi:hypothetical protein
VPLLILMRGGVRSRFSEFLWVTRRFRDKWGATRVQTPSLNRASAGIGRHGDLTSLY